MKLTNKHQASASQQSGMTLVELLVALAIGSFLMIGALQVYNQSRQAFVINESIARVQETAQFAMDTLESDLRMASNWGLHSRSGAVEGRSLIDDPNPLALPAPTNCGANWALDLNRPVEGDNNGYNLLCAPNGGAQANSDTITTRRATVAPTPLTGGRLQIQSTRIQGALFADGNIPIGFTSADSETHDLKVSTYYVSDNSTLIPGVPTLRRHTLVSNASGPAIVDQEIAPGVENIQMQLGVDVDEDNTVDRYINPDDPILNPTNPAFIPSMRVITVRVWIIVRGVSPEIGIQDYATYAPGDVNLGQYNDQFRRMQVSKTILLRNARS